MSFIPYLGQTVLVQLTQAEVNQVEAQRTLFRTLDVSHLHEGEPLQVDAYVPAIVCAIDAAAGRTVNLRLLTDGTDWPWLTGVSVARLATAEPPRAVPSPAQEVDRLWPYIRAQFRNMVNSSEIRVVPSPSSLQITD